MYFPNQPIFSFVFSTSYMLKLFSYHCFSVRFTDYFCNRSAFLNIVSLEDLMAILLAAPIGAGKTTVSDYLGSILGSPVVHESVGDNPILPLYYQDQKKYGLLLQMYFLQRRTKDLISAYAIESNTAKHVISDRSIYEDASIFARQLFDNHLLEKEEYDVYLENANVNIQLLDLLSSQDQTKQDLLIFLDPPFERTLAQIKARGRDFEQFDGNPELKQYYRDIYDRYQEWFAEYQRTPKIKLVDFSVDTHEDRVKLYNDISQMAHFVGVDI
ncbi:hypothetical protein ESZ50_00965 [Weissella muntiaci]|uniref:Deoxynucleoside kinase domain-containing protein n=2 Tax=Weissella muntiaci TaxID=2508881 RepID=A0A6C2CBE5_9LACO|nr:hypothetical protein ESZ50_00965 [Weissella muntiaci]